MPDNIYIANRLIEEARAERDRYQDALQEVESVPLPLFATCDWGDCDRQADYIRWSEVFGWLPVCERHRKQHA